MSVADQQGVDVFQAVQDLVVVQKVEFEAAFVVVARPGRQHAVQVELGAVVVPGLGEAQRHDEHPGLGGQRHVTDDRRAPGLDHLQRGGGHQRVQVGVEPLVLAQADVTPVREGLAVFESPLQLIDDRPDHIPVEQRVGVGLETGLGRRLEPRGGDVVALLDQLLFDVAGETGADREDRF